MIKQLLFMDIVEIPTSECIILYIDCCNFIASKAKFIESQILFKINNLMCV